jgi:hypothetical protein
MQKMEISETGDWRISPSLRRELEEAARSREMSVPELLEQILREWLERVREREDGEKDGVGEEERQRQLRAAAMKFVGAITGDNPCRAENVSAEVRARLARKYGR